MRILNVSAFFESHGGGVEIVAGEMARALGQRGHDSRLTGAAFDMTPVAKDVTPVPLSSWDPVESRLGLPMPLLDGAGRVCLEEQVQLADAIIIHDALYSTSQHARRYALRHRKPWLVVQHIGMIPFPNPVLRLVMTVANRVVTRRTLEGAPQIVFISDTVRRQFEGLRYRADPKLMFNGIDHALFHPLHPERVPDLAYRFGLNPGRTNILFVGRFVQRKGLAVLRELAMLRPDIDIWLVGSGPIAPQTWSLTNVHVLGRLARDVLAQLYGVSDALVLPSVGEGFPLVIQEAMAVGLPVICGEDAASADPGASAFLTGIYVDLANPLATARRIAGVINTTRFAKRTDAAHYALANYDWNKNAAWIEQSIIRLRDEV